LDFVCEKKANLRLLMNRLMMNWPYQNR